MLYLNESHIHTLGVDWKQSIGVIERSVNCLTERDYAQPIKPYLRYGNRKNRIIAMPAFVGGKINMCGIKWIASFPDNIHEGLPRAHSVVILNDPGTGVPVGILNGSLVSAIRTASVSGLVIRRFLLSRGYRDLTIGIVGFGPIGQHHLEMCRSLLKDTCTKYLLYDVRGIDRELPGVRGNEGITVVDSWERAYAEADIFITCTVSAARYINRKPLPGSLHLNVSLRDYMADTYDWFKGHIIVDDWDEICRENTDIEVFHLEKGLRKEEVRSLEDILAADCFDACGEGSPVMFNPMGMAIFDIAIAEYYLRNATERKVGLLLN